MNGCCPTNADSRSHDPECYWYWPCGCPKDRAQDGGALPHRHEYKGVDDKSRKR